MGIALQEPRVLRVWRKEELWAGTFVVVSKGKNR
jgi:hypothetical protein